MILAEEDRERNWGSLRSNSDCWVLFLLRNRRLEFTRGKKKNKKKPNYNKIPHQYRESRLRDTNAIKEMGKRSQSQHLNDQSTKVEEYVGTAVLNRESRVQRRGL